MKIAERIAGTGLATPRLSDTVLEGAQDLVGELLLIGKGEGMQRLRLQVEVAAPYLKGAVVEAEPGLARELLARRLYTQGGASPSGLLPCNATSAASIDSLCSEERLEGVLVSALNQARPATQRQLAGVMQRTQAEHGTKWLIFSEQPIKTLVARKQLVPELTRVLPGITVRLTPLRERPEDLHDLASEVLRRIHADHVPLDPEAMQVLKAHRWPGDLDEFVRVLTLWAVEERTSSASLANILALSAPGNKAGVGHPQAQVAGEGPTLLQDVIDRHLLRILQRCNGNKLRAAEMLGISRSTLYRMLEAVTHV